MTNQEIYDKVATHLLTQNAKSKTGGRCQYRSSLGEKCAIGCLIPDEIYTPSMEGIGVRGLIFSFEKVLNLLKDVDDRLLDSLQGVHDNGLVSEWKNRLLHIAIRFNLNSQVLDKF